MRSIGVAVAVLFVAAVCGVNALSYADVRGSPYSVSYDHRAITINGERQLLISGSIHYPRSTPGMWPDLFARTVAADVNLIQVYVFWNYHEAERGVFDFTTENRNITQFLTLAAEAGLWVNLRIGPYVCAEWDYGGLPYWLRDDPNMVFRDNDPSWLAEMEAFMRYTVLLIEPFLARNGGPIILLQTENEYGNVESFYGKNGSAYVEWNGALAASLNTDTPWIMCQQPDAPQPLIQTCNGFYCDNWLADHFKNFPNQPAMYTENWPGWFQHWGEPVPHRPTQDVMFSVTRWFARGGTHQNYYMWHGGTTFGRWTGGPLIVTSYDYDVALSEFGLPSEPKYSQSKALHSLLLAYSHALLSNDPPVAIPLGVFQEAHIYGATNSAGSLVFLSNIDSVNNATVTLYGRQFVLPAWSVVIVDGQSWTVIYNTASTNNEHKPIVVDPVPGTEQPRSRAPKPDAISVSPVSVSYVTEPIGGGASAPIVDSSPREQLSLTRDRSDYLWYAVSVTVPNPVPSTVPLVITSAQDYLYVYAEFGTGVSSLVGGSMGSDGAVTFQVPIPAGTAGGSAMVLQILVLTQGLINYGPFLERWTRGITGTVTWNGVDITHSNSSETDWIMTASLLGEVNQYYNPMRSAAWSNGVAPASDSLVWYNVSIPTPNAMPAGSVWALDLSSMGKGAVYINGHAMGRYWSIVATDGACNPCDYRGTFDPSNCRTGCGVPSQRYYHVPRDWLLDATAGVPNFVVFIEETPTPNPQAVKLVQMN